MYNEKVLSKTKTVMSLFNKLIIKVYHIRGKIVSLQVDWLFFVIDSLCSPFRA